MHRHSTWSKTGKSISVADQVEMTSYYTGSNPVTANDLEWCLKVVSATLTRERRYMLVKALSLESVVHRTSDVSTYVVGRLLWHNMSPHAIIAPAGARTPHAGARCWKLSVFAELERSGQRLLVLPAMQSRVSPSADRAPKLLNCQIAWWSLAGNAVVGQMP